MHPHWLTAVTRPGCYIVTSDILTHFYIRKHRMNSVATFINETDEKLYGE